VTVLEVIQRSTEFLTQKGVESPRLQTELLLAHVLKQPRMQLYLNFERVLSPVELDALRSLVKRRSQREPLQHIVGSTSFCGLEVAVTPAVLVPRPETELLAELGWSFLQQLSPSNQGPICAADIGTGSGCIAIALAVKCPSVQVYAVDISNEALEITRKNARDHGVIARVECVQGDRLTALPPGTRFDLLVSNPPYIPTAEIETLDPEVRNHDPHQALDGGLDGLDFYRYFAAQAGSSLKPGGKLMLEFGDDQAQPIRQIFEEQKWIVERVAEDYTQRPRILIVKQI
jgi:release factor glutamine methyltransferase